MRWSPTIPKECRATLRCLQAYLDDECDPQQVWSVARHLGRCEDCFADAETFRRIKDAIGSLRAAPDAAAMRRLHDLIATLDAST